LTIVRDCLTALVACPRVEAEWEIVVFCHSRRLYAKIQAPFLKYIEVPSARGSWIRRIYYEYLWFWIWSRSKDIELWLSLHDATPTVAAKRRVVYCHCAVPFYRGPSQWLTAPAWEVFRRLYYLVYSLNLNKNHAVVVQQQWFREEFWKLTGFDKRNIIVAKPQHTISDIVFRKTERETRDAIRLFYPGLPRIFKNFEVLLDAMVLVDKLNVQLVITIKGTENAYAKALKDKYGKAKNVEFVGYLSVDEVQQQYERSDALVFPSKLETWGLPLSEFRRYGKPIMAVDLPYAREALSGYPNACYFEPDNFHALAELIRMLVNGKMLPFENCRVDYDEPYAASWDELLPLLGI
jgi:glycosyltransferase involved in cell wall biosynthesis